MIPLPTLPTWMRRLLPAEVVDWAHDLVETLQQALDRLERGAQGRDDPAEFPHVTVAVLLAKPPRFRGTRDGRMVWVVDAAGGPCHAYWHDGAWRRMRDGTPID